MRKLGFTSLAIVALAGCQHTPPLTLENVKGDSGTIIQQNKCDFQTIEIEAALPDEEKPGSIVEGVPGDMLFLSGGSQNGAFGAGYLSAWGRGNGGLPEFSLVTGISTGALLATGAFINRPDLGLSGYTIEKESEILNSFIGPLGAGEGLGERALLTALRQGAISDLTPLRAHLGRIFSDDVFQDVADRYAPTTENGRGGPRLIVGATDVDRGQAVAFDLTHMAHKIVTAPDEETKQLFKDCYIEALVASSIVPPAAKPVFIDNRMYIDGGIRFAVFDDRIRSEFSANAEIVTTEAVKDGRKSRGPFFVLPGGTGDPEEGVRKPMLYIILNGDGELDPNCWSSEDEGRENCDSSRSTNGQHKDWDLVSLAFRSVEIFTNQVERLSVARITDHPDFDSEQINFVRIVSDDLRDEDHAYSFAGFDGRNTCNEWRAIDDRIDNPLQFHRRFMRCLIAYGEAKAIEDGWLGRTMPEYRAQLPE